MQGVGVQPHLLGCWGTMGGREGQWEKVVEEKEMKEDLRENSQFALLAPLDRINRLLLHTRLVFLLPQRDRHQRVICPVLPLHVQTLRLLH